MSAGVRTNDSKVSFASIKNALTAERFLSVQKTADFIFAVPALNSTDHGATDP